MVWFANTSRIGLRIFPSSLVLFFLLRLAYFSEGGGALKSVPDLVKVMYPSIEGYPCVRLLNLSGEIGCANPGSAKVIAPIVSLESAEKSLKQPSAILVPVQRMQAFFQKVLEDRKLARNVAGVLVGSTVSASDSGPPSSSPARKFPLAEFAPYSAAASGYEWNPAGSGIMWNKYDFPVFLLSRNDTLAVKEMADRSSGESSSARFVDVAEFDLVMQTTEHRSPDSEACLRSQTCLPLGGYSVWSSLPPSTATSRESPKKPLILSMASMDSASFFRDRSMGADSPLSGLISLLAAVDALSRLDSTRELKKQLVFLVFTGEAWGYLGSRKFLSELDAGTSAVDGLDASLIEQVLEIGSVGKALKGETATFFAHLQEDAPAVEDLMTALNNASASIRMSNVEIQRASASNPGVPPSSLMAFLKKNSSISGVVLEEFDRTFVNGFYKSHLDDLVNVNSSSIVAAASLVARTLYILAKEDLETALPTLDDIKVNASLIEELMDCLLSCNPGFSCDLVKSFISASSTCPNHYVGVFLDAPSDKNGPQHVDDTARFLWNFLADRTSARVGNNASTCSGTCRNAGEVCVGSTSDRKGRCVFSSTRYVPAYSTRLAYANGLWQVSPANSSDPLGMVDPVWTESYWNVIGLRAYKVQSYAYDLSALFGGVAVTLTAYAAVMFSQSYFLKVVKHD